MIFVRYDATEKNPIDAKDKDYDPCRLAAYVDDIFRQKSDLIGENEPNPMECRMAVRFMEGRRYDCIENYALIFQRKDGTVFPILLTQLEYANKFYGEENCFVIKGPKRLKRKSIEDVQGVWPWEGKSYVDVNRWKI